MASTGQYSRTYSQAPSRAKCSDGAEALMKDIRLDTTVLIVDDHQSFAESLAISLESRAGFAVVGVANFAEEAVNAAVQDTPDEIVLDIRLGLDDGLAVARRIREILPDVLIIVVSASDDWSWIARAASAGANGYVAKSGSLNELVDVLRAARLGAFLIAPSLRHRSRSTSPNDPVRVLLTARETEVLALLDNGVGPKQIARVMNISVNTCRGYVKSMYAKLGVGSQLEALAAARRYSLIDHGSEIPQ
jgi:DNA-binding NarL/FixJ family response regulator